MSYCKVSDVKGVLHLNAEETTYDTEIADCITSADGMIDDLLAGKAMSVPAETPQTIKDASKHLAAHFFRARRSPPPDKPVLFSLGMSFLKAFMGTGSVGEMVD